MTPGMMAQRPRPSACHPPLRVCPIPHQTLFLPRADPRHAGSHAEEAEWQRARPAFAYRNLRCLQAGRDDACEDEHREAPEQSQNQDRDGSRWRGRGAERSREALRVPSDGAGGTGYFGATDEQIGHVPSASTTLRAAAAENGRGVSRVGSGNPRSEIGIGVEALEAEGIIAAPG